MINLLDTGAITGAVILGLAVGGTSVAADTDPMDIATADVQKLMKSFSESTRTITQTSGKNIYATLCAGCHMPRGEGAQGSGFYPKLAHNQKLATGAYPMTVVITGQRGMPSFAHRLDDQQIAAVVNYVRTHFGNDYDDNVTANDVSRLRQQAAPDTYSSYDPNEY